MTRYAKLVASSGPTRFGPGSKLRQCQAKKKRTGDPCRQPAMKGKRVCRMHGGYSQGPRKKRPIEGRSEYFMTVQLPRRQVYAEEAARGEARPPSRAAEDWVAAAHPDLLPVAVARRKAAAAFDAYEGGVITWGEFQRELSAARILV